MFNISKLPGSIDIGYVGETNFRTIEIDMTPWMESNPDGVPSIVCIRPKEKKTDAYVAATTFENNVLSWTITAGDIGSYEGTGEIQIWLEEEENETVNKRGKSVKVKTIVHDSASDPAGEVPAAQQAVLEQMTQLKNETVSAAEDAEDAKDAAEQAAADAEAAVVHQPYIDSTSKHWMVWDSEEGEYTDTEITAEGQPGQPGDPTQLIDDTAGEGATGKTWSANKLDETTGLLLNDIDGFADTDANLKQLEDNGYQKYFPEWESGEWNNNGKGTNNNTQRSKSLIYLPSGTYTVYSKIQMSVFGYPTTGATDGNAIQWKLTGEQKITITTRHYVGFMVEMASDDGVPTGNYAVIPSAVSDAIANATKALNTANEAISKTEYSDGIFHVITEGTTLYEKKGIGSGILVGAVVNMTNDNYANVLEVPVTAGKTYRMKARAYNNYYLVHFTDANNILIEKTGQNTTGSTTTMVDVVATAPAGATKAYLSGMKNTMILCEVLEPYTVKQIVDMEHKPTRGSFCIMEFNVGDWYEGRYRDADHTGIIPADETIYENYMSLFNGIFGRYKPDIAMLNEDARYMCLNTHDDDRSFVGQYFRHQYSGLFQSQDKTDVFNTLACAFPMFDLSVRNFTDTESNMHRNYVKGYTYLNGKKVCIISAHLSSDLATAKLNAAELLADLQTEDPEYLICCGDFNYDTNVAEIAAFETAGYTISRGNVVHDGHTYGPGDLIVTTSNITVKSVFCDTQKIDASFVEYIDHLPTIAYLEIY